MRIFLFWFSVNLLFLELPDIRIADATGWVPKLILRCQLESRLPDLVLDFSGFHIDYGR